MSEGLHWGDSPIDLPEEAPLEVKFLAPPMGAEALPADMGPHERMAVLGRMVDAGEGAPDVPALRKGLGWMVGAMVVNTLALLAFNSHALANWADQLPVSPLTAPVVTAADQWHARAEALGLNAVVNRVEATANTLRKATWP